MTESSLVAFKRGPSPETTLNVFGVDVTMLVENEDTGGRFGVLEYVSKPGHEPPPHRHEHEDEVFYIIEGRMEAHFGDQVLEVAAGECLTTRYLLCLRRLWARLLARLRRVRSKGAWSISPPAGWPLAAWSIGSLRQPGCAPLTTPS